ncbi:MAG: hypothetical protein QG597_627, partial [Actinomycetota bacterium]|nr:hypothetical protein [Actinomycetota bacterium]
MTSGQEWGELVTRAVEWSRDRMEAARVDRQRRTDPVFLARVQRQAALEQRARAQQAQVVAEEKYRAKLTRVGKRATTGAYVAAGTAGLGVLDLATGIGGQTGLDGVMPGAPGFWFLSAAVAGLIGWRARATLRTATPPPKIALPPVPPPVLTPGTVGAEEAADVYRAEGQLIAMIPAVDQLHGEAGMSLRATMTAVQPR